MSTPSTEFTKRSRKPILPRYKLKKIEFLGIQLKTGYRLSNLLAVPLMNATLAVTNFYFNIGIVFMLRDPSSFGLKESDLTKTVNNMAFTSMMF